jgi:hypothetical protein
MKAFFLIPGLIICIIFFTGCKQGTISVASSRFDEISKQLEELPSEINTSSNPTIKSNYQVLPNESALIASKILVKERNFEKPKIYTSSKLKNNANYNEILFDKKQKQKILSPKEFDKDNVYWRIGKIIFKVGLTVMGLLGAVSFGVSSNNGFIFSLFGGLVIGLIIMALSIPFFVIGLISELMKNRKSNLEDTNEI